MSIEPAGRMPPESQAPGRPRWSAWWSLLPIGFGAWAPIVAGVQMRRRVWWLLGSLWTLISVVGLTWAAASHGKAAEAGMLILIGWIGAVATSFAIRHEYARLAASPFRSALETASDRVQERDLARRLIRERLAVARELGVGRPDLAGAHDAGLVDFNNASAAAIAALPGIDDALATRIIEARSQSNGFSSIEDMGSLLNLDPQLVESIRDRAVFLPR